MGLTGVGREDGCWGLGGISDLSLGLGLGTLKP